MQERSPTTDPYGSIRCFGLWLSPEHLRRAITRPVSYYALFKWWLLLSQHPGCLRNLHFLGLHLAIIRDLSRRSGLFPF